jgi:Skp family chaperone for outer membrane proteins
MLQIARTVSIAAVLAAVFVPSVAAQTAEPFRIGAVSFAHVARASKAGRAAITALDAFGKQKSLEVETKAAELQKQQAELQKSASMSPRAAADLQRAFEKARLEFERFQQDAQAEVEALQTKFDAELRVKLAPIVDEISKEKGLHFVFGLEQAAIVWWSPAVDISAECVKRLDALKAP